MFYIYLYLGIGLIIGIIAFLSTNLNDELISILLYLAIIIIIAFAWLPYLLYAGYYKFINKYNVFKI